MPGLFKKPQNLATEESCDVFIVGSGPIGAYYARTIFENRPNLKILMAEIGANYSSKYGTNAKNAYIFNSGDDGLDILSHIVKGELVPISSPIRQPWPESLEPRSQPPSPPPHYRINGSNPDQKDWNNMPSASASYQVGGMGGHWTCCTPRPYNDELPTEYPTSEFEGLLEEAERIFNTNQESFADSIRGQIMVEELNKEFHELKGPRQVQMLPLACKKDSKSGYIRWHGPDDLFGPLATPNGVSADRFQLWEEHIVRKLQIDSNNNIVAAEVEHLPSRTKKLVKAKHFIVAGGAFSTPQLLWNSGIRPKALGHYLNEHPMCFTQIVLSRDLVLKCKNLYHRRCKDAGLDPDPYSIPDDDPIPNVWIPYSDNHPYHCQVHRDSFPYSTLPENLGVDRRLIIDLRWFTKKEIRYEDRIKFSSNHKDMHGMPQVTFEYGLSARDEEVVAGALKDMQRAAGALGGYLPGSPPLLLPRGSSLHYMGLYRVGHDCNTSVCDIDSKVWGYNNLYLGGNGIIPTSNTCNSTLTSLAIAIRGAKKLLQKLI
jgi:pyranose oxidase